MARISELHYSNAYAASSGVSEFLEVAIGASDVAADFVVSFYQADGTVGFEVALTDPGILVSVDPDNGETVFVISADHFPIMLTDPDGGGSNNYEAFALTNTTSGTVVDFYDIGGGTQNILALDGAAAGAVSDNLAVLVGPNSTTTTLQFNQPNPDTLTYTAVGGGDTGIACFAGGTQIATPDGARAIEDLVAGDMVLTRDAGAMPIAWIGHRRVAGSGAFAPVRIPKGVLGALRDHRVSQQHRVLISGWQAELLFGAPEILVPAKALCDGGFASLAPCREVTYFHILLEGHQIVTADGVQSESYDPSVPVRGHFDEAAADELDALFPELALACHAPCLLARPTISVREGRALGAML